MAVRCREAAAAATDVVAFSHGESLGGARSDRRARGRVFAALSCMLLALLLPARRAGAGRRRRAARHGVPRAVADQQDDRAHAVRAGGRFAVGVSARARRLRSGHRVGGQRGGEGRAAVTTGRGERRVGARLPPGRERRLHHHGQAHPPRGKLQLRHRARLPVQRLQRQRRQRLPAEEHPDRDLLRARVRQGVQHRLPGHAFADAAAAARQLQGLLHRAPRTGRPCRSIWTASRAVGRRAGLRSSRRSLC